MSTASPFTPTRLIAALAAALASPAFAAGSFTVSGPSTTAQTLNAGQTGVVTSTGALTVSGSSVAVTVAGNGAAISNQGTISQTGNGRVIRDNTGVTGLVVTNGAVGNTGATMIAADADVIQMNKAVGGVALTNYGSMISTNASAGGSQVIDFNAVTSSPNVVNNYGLMKAFEADSVRTGVNGVVYNAGTILSVTAAGSSSDGVDFQANSGAQVTNDIGGLIEGGRHGITGGAADASASFLSTIVNRGLLSGDNGSGINIDGFNGKEVVTVTNGGTIVGNGVAGDGDGDGVDVDGLVNLTNTGTIRSLNSFSAVAGDTAFSEGLSVGGGTITNSGRIEGLVAAGNTNAVGRGITLVGNDITTGVNAGQRDGIYGNAVVNNNAGATIRGQSDSAIVAYGLASGFTVTINNAAGATLVGGGTANAAVKTGLDNDTVTNGGKIDGSSSGKAIDLGGGDNTLNIVGGQAVILGDINGGAGGHNRMTLDLGAGDSFAYAGAISNFDNVDIRSGKVTLTGASTYAGATTLSGGVLILDGRDRLSSASALALDGGTLRLVDAGGANGQGFSSLSLGGDSIVELGGSSITFANLGAVTAGKTLALIDYVASASPNYAIRFLGDLTGSAGLQALMGATTIDGLAVKYRFDGVYTDVSVVPEPTDVALLLAGLGLVGVAARRRNAAAQA